MKTHTGITDKEKLHLMRQQLATQDRVIADLRGENAEEHRKRISAVCRAKAFQKHLKDAKGKVAALERLLKGAHDCMNAIDKISDETKRTLAEESDRWQEAYLNQRKAFVDETAAHVNTLRNLDEFQKLLADSMKRRLEAQQRHTEFVAKADGWLQQWQADIQRGDLWCFAFIIVSCIAIGQFIALLVRV